MISGEVMPLLFIELSCSLNHNPVYEGFTGFTYQPDG